MTFYRSSFLLPVNPYSWNFCDDCGIIINNGIVSHIGPFNKVRKYTKEDYESLDGIILPGFIDVHLHWVQHEVQGLYSGELLGWLKNSIWPEESLFKDDELANARAEKFFVDILKAGTVMGMVYSSTHENALNAFLNNSKGNWVIGNTLMYQNAPDILIMENVSNFNELENIIKKIGSNSYALTPRFAPNCNRNELNKISLLARKNKTFIQTHLSESVEELKWVKELFPTAHDYTDVYDMAGLINKKSMLGHCIELSRREYEVISKRRAWIAHCPSSNEALNNARMKIEMIRQYDINFALATDIGAGPSHSMLHVMQRFLSIHEQAGIKVLPQEALYRSTIAGANFMKKSKRMGNLCKGSAADFVLLPAPKKIDNVEGWFMDLISGSINDLENRSLGTWIDGTQVSF